MRLNLMFGVSLCRAAGHCGGRTTQALAYGGRWKFERPTDAKLQLGLFGKARVDRSWAVSVGMSSLGQAQATRKVQSGRKYVCSADPVKF